MSERATTHWRDCWREPDHHACAVGLVERQAAELEQWRARYMAAHEILLLVEQLIESGAYTSERAGTIAIDWRPYERMRDAFLAYRASIEAGAPLRWAVLEQEVAG